MEEFQINKASYFVGKIVKVKGWIRHIRSSGSIYFIEVRDGFGEIQCVVIKDEVEGKVFDECSNLKLESSLIIEGALREEKRAPGGYEILVKNIQVIDIPDEEYPISKKSHGIDFLMERRHLWLRSKRQWAILRVRSEIERILREFFYKNDFVLIDTPILTGSIGESAGNLFETDYFDLGKAYLAQTGQLYLEAAASSFKKVFSFGPTFRAEKSKTRRHLTEFWMLEAEVAFYDSNNNMKLQEEMISYVISEILNTRRKELEILERDIQKLEAIKPPFPRISYGEAIEILRDKGFTIKWGDDIGGDEETAISTNFHNPVFIYNYPSDIKAFYMKPNPQDKRTVLCDDMIAPEGYGEVIGGSQRDDDYDSLVMRIKKFGLDPDKYNWYLDLRKFGSVPHSGFGLGVERLVSWICGLQHVRESIAFPRLINRIYP